MAVPGRECQTRPMAIEQWWARLPDASRSWLIAHNGDTMSAEISRQVMDAGGPAALTDDDVDWIEAVANDEDATGS
jgi:hypothetical protein